MRLNKRVCETKFEKKNNLGGKNTKQNAKNIYRISFSLVSVLIRNLSVYFSSNVKHIFIFSI